jgi:hypothetical protein
MLVLARDYGDRETALRAADMLRTRHERGDANAARQLAQIHAAGGPLPDPALERAWLERAAETYPASALALGRLLLDRGEAEAGRTWIVSAAERGHQGAQVAAARLLLEDADPARQRHGEDFAREAAGQGHQGAMLRSAAG